MAILTYDEVHILVNNICAQIIKASADYDGVYCIRGGGLVAGAMIAYKLNIPVTSVFNKRMLIVDDCIMTGRTIRPYVDLGIDIAVLRCHESRVHLCRYFGEMKSNDYITYPWEMLKK